MKKVYFACSIRAGRDDSPIYESLVMIIHKYAEVLTEVFADQDLTTAGTAESSGDIWSNDVRWMGQADAIIAEVTTPSLGVGYEIAKANELNKPVLCLYRPSESKKLSAMIEGNPKATVFEYNNLVSAEHAISAFLNRAN
jgi:hypothetical protein